MKIATHNLEFLFGEGIHNHSRKQWTYTAEYVEARINHFAQLFSKIDADIFLLQEVASKKVIERIIAKTNINYSYFIANPDKNGVGNAVLYKQMDAICSSIPAVASLPVFIEGDTDTIGSRIWPRRDFVHMETTWKGKKLHILNIHIKSNFLMPEKSMEGEEFPMKTQIAVTDGIIRSEFFRLSQAKKVRELIDGFFEEDENVAVVVGGDINAPENNPIFRIIQGAIKEEQSSLLSTTSSINEEERFTSYYSNGKKALVDYILMSKSLESNLANIQILDKHITPHKNISPNPTFIESDHAPVIIEFH